jgi:hypothetical protein
MSLLSADGHEEANRPIEVHLQLQALLRDAGFLESGAVIDGTFGANTRRAIALYQASEGIGASVPGVLDDRTAEMLMMRPRTLPNIRRSERPSLRIAWPDLPSLNAPMRIWAGWNGSAGNCDDCQYIFAEGIIDAQAASRLDALLRGNSELAAQGYYRRTLYLHSAGGNVDAAIDLGRTIRRWRLDTAVAVSVPFDLYSDTAEALSDDQSVDVRREQATRFQRRLARLSRSEREDGGVQVPVPGSCSSACFFAFLGGVNRTTLVELNSSQIGRVRVHQFTHPSRQSSSLDAFTVAQQTTARLASFITQMGADSGSLILAAAVPTTELRTLSRAELQRYRITTDIPDQSSDWSIQWITNQDLAAVSDFTLDSRQMSHAIICHTNSEGQREVRFAVGLRDPFRRYMSERDYLLRESTGIDSTIDPRGFFRGSYLTFLREREVSNIVSYNSRPRDDELGSLEWPVEDREFHQSEDAPIVDMINVRHYTYLVFRLPSGTFDGIRTSVIVGYNYMESHITTNFGGGMGLRGPRSMDLTGPWHLSPQHRARETFSIIANACVS